MPLVRIDNPGDARLEVYRNLKQTNETVRRGLFIAEGDKLVRRLLAGPLGVESILLSEPYVADFQDAAPPDVPTFVVREEWIEGLVGFNFHRGILACGRRPRPAPSPADLFASDAATGNVRKPCTIVVCPDVQDPENLGAIIRLAAGFGVVGIVLGPRSADPFSRRVQRVSMGNVYRMPIVPTRDIVAVLGELRERFGVVSWATVLDDAAAPLGTIERPPRLALVFGSEGHGLARDVVAACDRKVTIPMQSGVDSLNVAVAAGIFLHELLR
jgi:tRNA G18 (ribose-2'-O)-methylase SpoU